MKLKKHFGKLSKLKSSKSGNEHDSWGHMDLIEDDCRRKCSNSARKNIQRGGPSCLGGTQTNFDILSGVHNNLNWLEMEKIKSVLN